MKKKDEMILIKESQLKNIISKIYELQKEVQILRNKCHPIKNVLTNNDMKELLQVNNKLLKKYRDSGLLGYSSTGGKYWYVHDDVQKFLINSKYGG